MRRKFWTRSTACFVLVALSIPDVLPIESRLTLAFLAGGLSVFALWYGVLMEMERGER